MTGQDDRPRNASIKRSWILTIWTFGFLADVVIVPCARLYFYRASDVAPENFREPIMKVFEDVLASYGVYVTTILTFLFGKRTGVESRPRFLGWLAIAVTFVWVAVFTILLVGCVFFRWFDVDDHAEVLEQWAKATALIVTPLIAYYFSLDREQQP